MALTERQEKALNALDWLLDDRLHRSEGRTTIYAVALIRAALRSPGHSIEVLPLPCLEGREGRPELWSMIEDLVLGDTELRRCIEFNRRDISIRSLSTPMRNWTPDLPETGPSVKSIFTRSARPDPKPMPEGPTVWERLVTEDSDAD